MPPQFPKKALAIPTFLFCTNRKKRCFSFCITGRRGRRPLRMRFRFYVSSFVFYPSHYTLQLAVLTPFSDHFTLHLYNLLAFFSPRRFCRICSLFRSHLLPYASFFQRRSAPRLSSPSLFPPRISSRTPILPPHVLTSTLVFFTYLRVC